MKKAEILKNYRVSKINDTVFIQNEHFVFSYTPADNLVKDEYKGVYKYFGGLQSPYREEDPKHKLLETWLCELAEKILKC